MSVPDRIKLDNLLRWNGVQRDDETDDSVFEFLFEALHSKTLENDEKVEWLCMTVPALYASQREDIDYIIREFCSDQKPSASSPSHPKTKFTTIGDVKSITNKIASTTLSSEKETSPALQKVVDDIKFALSSRELEGSGIVEEELVEYLLTFVDELEIDSECVPDSKVDELNSILISFFTEVEEDADALTRISNILCAANYEKRRLKFSEILPPPKNPTTARSSSSLKSVITSISEDDEEETEQNLDDIASLVLMMPQTPADLIRYVYYVLCGSNRLETAGYLVARNDDESIGKLQQSKDIYDKKLADEAKLSAAQKKKMKSLLCSKYGNLLVKPQFNVKGKEVKSKTPLPMQFIDAKSKESKIRFRDDHVVSYRGEKTIVVHDQADDYDGGSRGIVKTKGKRGPGFIKSG